MSLFDTGRSCVAQDGPAIFAFSLGEDAGPFSVIYIIAKFKYKNYERIFLKEEILQYLIFDRKSAFCQIQRNNFL